MTKIYIYCLFDEKDIFCGAYSSLKAIHRDALRIANSGTSQVFLETEGAAAAPSLRNLRNIFKGKCDAWIRYRGGKHVAKIVKTKLRE